MDDFRADSRSSSSTSTSNSSGFLNKAPTFVTSNPPGSLPSVDESRPKIKIDMSRAPPTEPWSPKPTKARLNFRKPNSSQLEDLVNPFESRPKILNDNNSSPIVSGVGEHNPLMIDFDSIPAVASKSTSGGIPEQKNLSSLCPCSYCGRKFNADSVQRHEVICCKGANKPRKQFDSKSHRIAGLIPQQQANQKALSGVAMRPVKTARVNASTWRDKSNQLRAAIGAARAVDPYEKQKFEAELAKANKQLLKKCDYCGRSFNPEAAERHIPICERKAAQMVSRLPPASRPMDLAVTHATGQQRKLGGVSSHNRSISVAPVRSSPVNAPRRRVTAVPVVSHGSSRTQSTTTTTLNIGRLRF